MVELNAKQIDLLRGMTSGIHDNLSLSEYRNSNILVTGATGHLGVWLSLLFSHESSHSYGIELTVETSRKDYLFNLTDKLNFKRPKLLDINNTCKFDAVFDMSLPDVKVNDHENYGPIVKFLENFIKQKKRVSDGGILVIPSSGAVYGTNYNNPRGFIESDTDRAFKQSTYGRAKFLIENLSSEIEAYSVPIFRIFSVFGPLMRPDSPLIGNNFFAQCQKTGKIVLAGEGKSVRNMSFVSDIVSQMVALAPLIKSENGPINLGSDNNVSVKDFASLVAQSMSSSVMNGNLNEVPQIYIPVLDKLSKYNVGARFNLNKAIELTRHFYSQNG